jgi:hypothetical protein
MGESLTHVNSTVMVIGKAPCIVAEESAMAKVRREREVIATNMGRERRRWRG